jgi:hypothetical protein
MSTSLITKPILYVQSAVNGVITCIEKRMRPEDFGHVFPANQFPTFPAIDPTLTRPMLPIDLAYGVISKHTRLPQQENPADQWEAAEKLWLHTVQTNGYNLGEQATFHQADALYTARTFIYKPEPPPGDMPTYDPNAYVLLEPVSYPVALTRDLAGAGPHIVTAIPKEIETYDIDVAWSESNNWASYYIGTANNDFLYVWDNGTYSISTDIHVIKDGVGLDALISYASTLHGCAIYGYDLQGPYRWLLSSDSGFHGNTETDRLSLRITAPKSPIMSHVMTPTDYSSIMPSLTALAGLVMIMVCGVSITESAAARRRLRRIPS